MLLFRVLSLVGLFLIIVLSLIPGDLQIRTPLPKTVEHFGAYFAVALVLTIGRASIAFTVAIAALLSGLAGFMEFLQELVPDRNAGYSDFIASALGAAAGALLAYVMNRNGVTEKLLSRMPLVRGRRESSSNPADPHQTNRL